MLKKRKNSLLQTSICEKTMAVGRQFWYSTLLIIPVFGPCDEYLDKNEHLNLLPGVGASRKGTEWGQQRGLVRKGNIVKLRLSSKT